MIRSRLFVFGSVLSAAIAECASAFPVDLPVQQDFMTSGFFQSAPFVRGQEAGSTRSTNRATSTSIFGVSGETSYFTFNFAGAGIVAPVTSAVFRVEVVASGFFPDPTPANPSEISIHRLTANPLSAINPTLASGAGSWQDFRDSQVTASSILSTTSVPGPGIYEWDVTDLVNEWVLNGDANFAYAIGTSAVLDPDADTSVAFVNSSFSGLGSQLTARITVIPAPGAGVVLAMAGALAARRRRVRASPFRS